MAIGNTMALPMFALPRELWLAVLPISVPQRILFAILAAVIGVPLLIGLPKIGVTVGTKLLDDNNYILTPKHRRLGVLCSEPSTVLSWQDICA